MESNHDWIWQHEDWLHFRYDAAQLLPELTTLARLFGHLEVTCRLLSVENRLEAWSQVLTDDAVETSAIEGEILRRSSVRSSVRKRLGLDVEQDDSNRRTDDLVSMLLDARRLPGSGGVRKTGDGYHSLVALVSANSSGCGAGIAMDR